MTTKRKTRHMRLPNGFGQISKINANLRNPYRAMVTIGKTSGGKPICKLLKPKAYFPTYNDAYRALLEYHDNPYMYDRKVTVKELYSRWSDEYYEGTTSAKTYKAAWNFCQSVCDMEVQNLRAADIKYCMEYGENTLVSGKVVKASPTAKANIKLLFNLMLDYAVEHEYVQRNIAREMVMPKSVSKEIAKNYKGHKAFSESDFKTLCQNTNIPFIEMAVVQCFTGMRPSELITIKCDNIDLDKMVMIGGSKTKAGRDRMIPIHPAIQNIIRKRAAGEYLYKMSYDKYRTGFVAATKSLGIEPHTLHDCRKHFVTMAKRYGLDEYAIKRIVGHRIADITENIYTERDVKWLTSEISKIPSVEIV